MDKALLAAHAKGDRTALISLYSQAAELALAGGKSESADFFLTHAYVFALEGGDPRAASLYQQLKARGREE